MPPELETEVYESHASFDFDESLDPEEKQLQAMILSNLMKGSITPKLKMSMGRQERPQIGSYQTPREELLI